MKFFFHWELHQTIVSQSRMLWLHAYSVSFMFKRDPLDRHLRLPRGSRQENFPRNQRHPNERPLRNQYVLDLLPGSCRYNSLHRITVFNFSWDGNRKFGRADYVFMKCRHKNPSHPVLPRVFHSKSSHQSSSAALWHFKSWFITDVMAWRLALLACRHHDSRFP